MHDSTILNLAVSKQILSLKEDKFDFTSEFKQSLRWATTQLELNRKEEPTDLGEISLLAVINHLNGGYEKDIVEISGLVKQILSNRFTVLTSA